ncbi:g-box-binding factor 4 [Phtheirospermum japonicum]|uniref:G-box-binding factor 4 n=1 Tax=Phtheirospermum japonicum TaxID=374723 RepID=A0A830BPK5_9LAMI|nr:g-box-binding factor 4 [Phtheirospermum japonicum]
MASSKLMASSTSRNSDLNRNHSACASSSDFIRIDSISNGSDNLASDSVTVDGFSTNAYVDQGHRPVTEAESSVSTLLSTEIALLDAAGAVTPISDGEFEPRRVVRKTVDDVWREIVAGKKSETQPPPKEEMMTLEDFLVKAGAAEEGAPPPPERGLLEVKEERLSGSMNIYDYENKNGVIGTEVGVRGLGKGRGKRSLSLLEPLDKVAQQRQRRMIKNRESAARSRERKQAYQAELESMVARLEEENEQLLKEKAEQTEKRFKQLMENVIPVVEKRKPASLRRIQSMEWYSGFLRFQEQDWTFIRCSATFVVDGVIEWKNPQVQIGDSVIFQHKYHYSLYIFQNKNAFNLCNFTQSTLLTKPNSTSYTWHTSRPGFFYFSFNNGSNGACLQGQKLSVEVSAAAPPINQAAAPPVAAEAPPPSSGGTVASSPAFPWPFRPRESASPGPAPGSSLTAAGPMAPEKEGVPFINSSPAVPLPTGEVDSATFRPSPTSSGHQLSKQVVGFYGDERGLSCVMLLLIVMMV